MFPKTAYVEEGKPASPYHTWIDRIWQLCPVVAICHLGERQAILSPARWAMVMVRAMSGLPSRSCSCRVSRRPGCSGSAGRCSPVAHCPRPVCPCP